MNTYTNDDETSTNTMNNACLEKQKVNESHDYCSSFSEDENENGMKISVQKKEETSKYKLNQPVITCIEGKNF